MHHPEFSEIVVMVIAMLLFQVQAAVTGWMLRGTLDTKCKCKGNS